MADAIVGREAELAALAGFLDEARVAPAAALVEGPAGAGKTTLWKHAVATAAEGLYRVLRSRPVESETALAYAALGDLFDGIVEPALRALPRPQRRALSVALLEADAVGRPPEPRAVATATLAAVRSLSFVDPVLVAIDDAQWLDPPSADVLRFVARRLESEPVGVLEVHRSAEGGNDPLGLVSSFRDRPLTRVGVGPLPLADFTGMVRARLQVDFPRSTVRALHRVAGGNAFFGLELARALVERGASLDATEELPIPQSLRELVLDRLGGLSGEARSTLLLAAALAQPTSELVEAALAGDGASVSLEEAVAAGVIEFDGDRIRFAHPLLASVLLADAAPVRRRRVHRRLAEVVSDPEERARHLALGSAQPDAEVAGALDEASLHASARGAPSAAAELAELAVRLTQPRAKDELLRRQRECGAQLLASGEILRARALLDDVVAQLPFGTERAAALLLLAQTRQDDFAVTIELLDQAIREAQKDPSLLARVHWARSEVSLVSGDLDTAMLHTRAAIAPAEETGDQGLAALALGQAGGLELLAGDITPGLLERAVELEQAAGWLPAYESPSRTLGLRRMFTGRFDEARAAFERALQRALEQGDDVSRGGLLLHLSELEVRAGNWKRAQVLAEDGFALVEQLGLDQARSALLYARALVASHLGQVENAREAAEEGLALSRAAHERIYGIYNASVLGFLELSLGDPAAADERLRPLVGEVGGLSRGEPSVYPLLADALEALIAVGELEEAHRRLEELERRARLYASPWAALVSARARVLLQSAEGNAGADGSDEALVAAERYAAPFERGRTLLALGIAARKARRNRAARAWLDEACLVFESLGARLWLDQARSEYARIGGRSPRPGRLSPTESRIAELVAAGRTNRQVAGALYMSPKTVEWNLSKIYRKLHVRSRTELAAKLSRAPPS
jgi:DNA-binding CsgD family transcriptional regulator